MKKTELTEKWNKVLEDLSQSLSSVQIQTFFTPLKPCSLNEKEGKIYFLSDEVISNNIGFYQNALTRYKSALDNSISKIFGQAYSVEITEENAAEEDPSQDNSSYLKEDALNPKYTFESFVAGPNSQLAFAASLSVAEGFSKKYNPLFIYSGSGLGKTHLMHAIGHYVMQNRPRKKVLYVSAETFNMELVEAIRSKTQAAFKEKYRNVDYLLFDDVQFIAGKVSVEEELFNTFEALTQKNKQIVFTSDRPPKDLNDIPERLTSRFKWGLTADIQAPTYETRIAILKNKAILENLDVSDSDLLDTLDLIAQTGEGNIRELEGALNRVIAQSSFTGEKISVSLTKRVLTEIFNTKEKEVTPSIIKKTVANYYGIKISDLDSQKRSRSVAYPRQIAIYLIRNHCPSYSYPKIGEIFGGRDHTTILHSYEKIEEEYKTNQELRNTIDNINKLIQE